MQTRRDFIKSAALLSGAAGCASVLPDPILRAYAIDPDPGTSYRDAEHVVILMQENRSFDHCCGSLQGVRGFNDPRAILQPNANPVWFQSYRNGDTYPPFHLDINDTRSTWMGYLPHTRKSQVEAWNKGAHNEWLESKRSGHPAYANLPLTMGYYTRADLPFYYSLADAFTVCDQHFCSVMTSTYPNRLMLWTGTIREKPSPQSKANLRNSDLQYEEARWRTFPELLEQNGVSWKVYQNEISATDLLTAEETRWLGNLGCNPLEYFERYGVLSGRNKSDSVAIRMETIREEIAELEHRLKVHPITLEDRSRFEVAKERRENDLRALRELQAAGIHTAEDRSEIQKALHEKAFVTNHEDPYFHSLTDFTYEGSNTKSYLPVPKGDVLYQFRKDVTEGNLPTVSWIVPSEAFSAHPSEPWFGAWHLSEVLNILTRNPEIWKKTIFILTYDENDGYFDHVPPFVASNPSRPLSGRASRGIDLSVEYVTLEEDRRWSEKEPLDTCEGPIGLGFRVPMIIASPWSRGGWVNSEVFDHTSSIQFLEEFLAEKVGKPIKETNLSQWRRAIAGNLTSVFRPYDGSEPTDLPFVNRDEWLGSIYRAKDRPVPSGFQKLTQQDLKMYREKHESFQFGEQEVGIRPSCALPYELYADGSISEAGGPFELHLKAGNILFADRSRGAPFNVYGRHVEEGGQEVIVPLGTYTLAAGDALKECFDRGSSRHKAYEISVYGPNGFHRRFRGAQSNTRVTVACEYERTADGGEPTGNLNLQITCGFPPGRPDTHVMHIHDNSYGAASQTCSFRAEERVTVKLDLGRSFGWYDVRIQLEGEPEFEWCYAGRVETGRSSFSDPLMGRVAV